jgi:hypothetical protein
MQYDVLALKLKPTLKPLEVSVLSIAKDTKFSTSKRLQKLNEAADKLSAWVGESLVKYTIMLPLRSTINAQIEALAKTLAIRIPYQAPQIRAQFNVSGAQLYAYGAGNLTLVRGKTQKGNFAKGDRVMVYFKQGGPVLTSIQEIVTNSGDRDEAYLLAINIPVSRFIGDAVLLIPQS